MLRPLLCSLSLSLLACGAPATPPPPAPEPPAATRATGPAASQRAPGEAPTLVLRAPGDPALALWSDGTLTAGGHVGHADVPRSDPYFLEQQGGLTRVVLEVGDARPAILVALPTEETEDPPNRYQLFVFGERPPGLARPRLERVLDAVLGSYGPTPLRFPGDGSVRYAEDAWTACERAGHPQAPLPLDEVTLRRDPGGLFREHARAPTGRRVDCQDLPG